MLSTTPAAVGDNLYGLPSFLPPDTAALQFLDFFWVPELSAAILAKGAAGIPTRSTGRDDNDRKMAKMFLHVNYATCLAVRVCPRFCCNLNGIALRVPPFFFYA